MVKSVVIHIDNSYSRITGLTPEQFKKLRAALSYQDNPKAVFYSGKRFPTTKYLIDSKGNFPTGLLNRVELFLKKDEIRFIHNDLIPAALVNKVNHCFTNTMLPYRAQLTAASKIDIFDRGILAMPTGTGKSLVIALIAARLNVRTLIVVPNLEIKKQLIETFSALFGDMSNITIENIDSNVLMTAIDYDCLIIDEAHHVAAKTYYKLNKTAWRGIRYRYMLTATPFRNNPEEQLLFEGIAGKIIYKLSYREAIREGYIVPVEAYYIELPKKKTNAYTWSEVYSELVVNNSDRNMAIANLLLKLSIEKKSTLCLVKEINHGNELKEYSGALFTNGQSSETREYITKFNKGKIKILIGTNGILGEGVDTKPCEYVIIAGLGKAKSAFMQQVGRALRCYPGKKSAKVIIIKDKSHKFTLTHFREQCKIFRDEYNVEPQKLEI